MASASGRVAGGVEERRPTSPPALIAVGGVIVHDDPVAQLSELWDEADILAQRLEAAARQGQSWTATDGTGAVSVTVNGKGHVDEVEIGQDWRRRVSGDELAGAVREAAEAAALRRFESWGEALAEPGSEREVRPRPMPMLGESLAYQLDELASAKMDSADGRAALRELVSLLESVERGIDQVTAELQVQAGAVFTGYNLTRDVSVSVNAGGVVSDISYNRHWLVNATPQNVSRETVSAFQAAYREASQYSPEAVIARSPLGEAQALAQDPFGLARRLHLRD